jgi:hypothetical protein
VTYIIIFDLIRFIISFLACYISETDSPKTEQFDKQTQVQGKSEVHPQLTMNTPFFNLNTCSGMDYQRHAPVAVPRERDPIPITKKKASWAPEFVGTGVEKINSLASTGVRTPHPPACSESQ